jgi:hypothetical protein
MGVPWFSTKLRYAVLREGAGLQFYMDSVRVLRAADYEHAFRRALAEGLRDEKAYTNADGQRVLWKLASIISLDRIGEDFADSQEVYSEPVKVTEDHAVPFQHEFHPETSTPTQTR